MIKKLVSLWQNILGPVLRHPVAGLASAFVVGILFWGAFNWSLEITNTEEFCISCHEMRDYVFKEYKKTKHYVNRTGVRASCPDCHVPKEWIYKVARKVGGTNELFHWAIGSIRTREAFEAKRLELAGHVWKSMKETDSRECRNCHKFGYMSVDDQDPRAFLIHTLGYEWDKTCIDCHKGIAHQLPKGFDKNALMDELHEGFEKEEIECRTCHTEMAGPPKGEGW